MMFKQSPKGYRSVRGTVIQEIQARLCSLGFDIGSVDGIWGGRTETAICSWQTQNALPSTGVVDGVTWQKLMDRPSPELWRRALQLTAEWEGTGYGGATGNFDGQGITWGVVGFTWKNGELQGLLTEIRDQHPVIFSTCFGPLEREILDVLGLPIADQMAWAQRISTNGGQRITPKWANAFAALGTHLEVREIEDARALKRYWAAASKLIQKFDLQSDAGQSLAFDIVVQLTVTQSMLGKIEQQITPTTPEVERMRVIATAAADQAAARWRNDVLSRKMTFVTGKGLVHGNHYDISCWGIG